jgi:serine/threonine-protein kinase
MTTKQLHAGDFVTNAVRLVRPLAEGGMGRVWVAEHLGLETQVVVKLMAPEIAARPDGAERFAREAAASAAVKSPHAVQVFDHGVTADGTPYIVMELLEGKDLAIHLAAHGRMPPAEVAVILGQVGKALARAHRASIIHRDVKPENIFLCDSEGGEPFVKLLDFGAARRDGGGSRATVPGQIMGTPYYMSPEQSVGAVDLTAASDVWSLGVVAFEALTGRRPFEGSSVGAVTMAIHGPTPKMTDVVADLPSALDEWFACACAQAPRERFRSVRDATRALYEAATGLPQIEPPTESLDLPAPIPQSMAVTAAAAAPPPASPSIPSLASTLPDPRASMSGTKLAAGGVMALAGLAMAAIVLGRSPAAPGKATAALAIEAPAEPRPPAEPPAAPAVPPRAVVAEEAPPAATTSPKPVQVAAERAPAKATRPGARVPTRARAAAPAKDGLDDDLVRLTNATPKQVDPPAAPPAPSPPADPEH